MTYLMKWLPQPNFVFIFFMIMHLFDYTLHSVTYFANTYTAVEWYMSQYLHCCRMVHYITILAVL